MIKTIIGFIKKNWQLLLFVLLVLILFYFVHNCANRLNIAEIKSDHISRMKILAIENEAIRNVMAEKDKIINGLEKSEKTERESRKAIEKEIEQLKKEYKIIPKQTEPFKKLEECQSRFDILQIDYNEKIILIANLNLDLDSYKKSEKNWNDQKTQYQEKEIKWKELEVNLNKQIEEQKIYIGKLEKKQRQPFIAFIIGPFVSQNGKFGIGAGIGVNVGRFFKWIF